MSTHGPRTWGAGRVGGAVRWPAFGGAPVYLNPLMRDGWTVAGFGWFGGAFVGDLVLFIGTRPLTDVEYAGEEGRYLVRRGLADVLAWLGEDVGPPPEREGRGRRLYDALLASVPA